MKRFFALLILAALFASLLCGCSNGQAKLTGIWSAQLDLTEAATQALADTDLGAFQNTFVPENFTVDILLTLNPSGSYTLKLDTASYMKQVSRLLDEAQPDIDLILEEEIAKQGYTMSVEEALAASGTNIWKFARQLELLFRDGDFSKNLKARVEHTGTYREAEGKLYFSGPENSAPDTQCYETYALEVSTLTLTGHTGDTAFSLGEIPTAAFPLTFHKVI